MLTKAEIRQRQQHTSEGRTNAKQRKQPKTTTTTTATKTNKTKKSQVPLKYVVLGWAGRVANCFPYFGKRGLKTDTAAKLHKTYASNISARERISKRLKRLTGRRSDKLLVNSSSVTSRSFLSSSSIRSSTSRSTSGSTSLSTSRSTSGSTSRSTSSSTSTISSSSSGSDSSYSSYSSVYDTTSNCSAFNLKCCKSLMKIPHTKKSKERKTNLTTLPKKRKPKRKSSQIAYKRPIVNLDSDVEKRFADVERCNKIAALSVPPSSRPFNNSFARYLV